MNNDKLVEALEKEGKLPAKPPKPKKPAEKIEAPNKKVPPKTDSNVFNLVIAVIVILGIIGIVFGYTKDKITELQKGGAEVTDDLEQQVADLKTQLKTLTDKATQLEKDSLASKNVVIDLFEKYRKIPENINTEGWKSLSGKDVEFALSLPQNWEEVQAVTPPAEADKNKQKEEIVVLQPTGDQSFASALVVKSDYADFADLSLKEKIAIFKELDALDTIDFAAGKMIYFINLDKDNKEVPTILILTADKIYRAIFNIADKKLPNYFQYRKEFEEIIATFEIVKAEKK
ncbi:hypothetical protein HZB94_02045 [Candidatus Falkowbacteria bacterium]|nr:hypothetical protein [Candidatus Falkowbacteria bacterium]